MDIMQGLKSLFEVNTQHYFIKTAFDILGINKWCKLLWKLGIRPNTVSIISILFGWAAAYFLFTEHHLFVALLCLHVFVDMIDGYFAREFNYSTNTGMFLDRFGDFSIYAIMLIKSFFYLSSGMVYYIILIMAVHMAFILRFGLLNKLPTNRIFIYFYMLGYFPLGLTVQAVLQTISTLKLLRKIIYSKVD